MFLAWLLNPGSLLLFLALLIFGAVFLWLTGQLPFREWLEGEQRGPVGIWAYPGEPNGWFSTSEPWAAFRFDGETVHFPSPGIDTHSIWAPFPADGVWRYKALWRGNDLFYITENGQWRKLATYADGHFSMTVENRPLVLVKVSPDSASTWNSRFLQAGPQWHYPDLAWRWQPLAARVAWPTGLRSEETEPVEPLRVFREAPQGLFTRDDHPTGIGVLTYSHDGRYLLAAGSARDIDRDQDVGYAKLCDTVSGEAWALPELPSTILAADFSPNGGRLALTGDEGLVSVWDLRSRLELQRLCMPGDQVRCVAFTRDGGRLAAGNSDGDVVVWQSDDGTARHHLRHPKQEVEGMAWRPSDDSLLVVLYKGINVWRLRQEGESYEIVPNHDSSLVAFDRAARRIATGNAMQMSVVDASSIQQSARCSWFQGHESGAVDVALSPDGQYLATCGKTPDDLACFSFDRIEEGCVILWDARSGRKLFTIRGYPHAVQAVAWSPDGKHLASSCRPESVEVWDVVTLLERAASRPPFEVRPGRRSPGADRSLLQGHLAEIKALAVSPDGKTLASGSEDETVRLWDSESREESAVLRGHVSEVTGLAFAPDSKVLASRSDDGEVKLWDVAAHKELPAPEGGRAGGPVVFSPDGKTLAFTRSGEKLCLWDRATGRVRLELDHGATWLHELTFSPDGKILAGLARKGRTNSETKATEKLYLWDPVTGRELTGGKRWFDEVHGLAFLPDGKTVVTTGHDGEVILWNLERQQERVIRGAQGERFSPLAVSPNGTLMAADDGNGHIKLWELPFAREIGAVTIPPSCPDNFAEGWVRQLVFSPDGKTLISDYTADRIKFWDLATIIGQQGNADGKVDHGP